MRMPLVGILLEDLQLTATGDQQGSITVDARMRSGGGELTVSGSTPVQPTSEEPGRIQIRGTRFEAVNNAVARAFVSPNLQVRLAGDSLDIRGEMDVPLARLEIHEMPKTALAPSDDVILLDSLMAPRNERPITAQVRVTLGDSVSFEAFNFDAELGGSIVMRQAPDELPSATGSLVIEEGSYRAWGQDLTIRDGVIRFAGGPVDNPGLSIRATRTIADTMTVGIAIGGTLKAPDVHLFSEPPMSDSQVLSYIVTGAPLGRGAGAGANILEKAFSTLGLLGGTALSRRVGDRFGLDEARIETRGDLQDASLVIGRYLSPKVYVSYGIGLFDPVSTLRLRYVLSNRFTLQAQTGGETSADALFKVRRGRQP
jgi:translocation and assembly module TamB